MVEEFMLLANISVAQKICEEFPDAAVLRRHPAPPASNFDPLLIAAQTKVSLHKSKPRQVGLVARVYASLRPGHTKDHHNGAHCLPPKACMC